MRFLTRLLLLVAATAGVGALAGCGGGPPTAPVRDVEFAQSMSTARTAYERGQTAQAVLLFERALRRAEARDDAADIGDAAYNLGVSLIDNGQPERAATLLETARAELGRAGLRTTDVRLVQAKLARRANEGTGNATAIAEEVSQSRDATPAERSQAFALLAHLALDVKQPDLAAARVRQARQALGQVPAVPPRSRAALEAGVLSAEGRLAETRGDAGTAATAYDRQAGMARQAALFGDMSTALADAGRAHGRAGNWPASADRLYRAARSLLAQGEQERGTQSAREAATAAERAGDAALAERARRLIEPAGVL